MTWPPPLPVRRTVLKWLHWSMLPLFVWFLVVQPRDVARWGDWAVDLHSVFGLMFVSGALFWTAMHLRRGLASRPGPKLRGWARRIHRPMHLALVWGLFGVALTGFLIGLTSSRLLFAGTILPIAPPLGLPGANALVGMVHSVEFYLLGLLAAGHAAFHVWRHLRLRDNALRIMAPRILHRFL
ncbi:cytochrome b/b6 domain-containing protein [Jannaschia sp. W003]|uniref:cytochrome b/b6 domain-containing protein n=1 Tax=Jannaschia sp. W003 TaxID=2867012 RepID=UPI0021A87F2C|nr:cytochrome b/b6 domain-containing protein [Jannaschia sp. W003]UWQ20765.1 cytochrome b/b6 domain-containing protein [Jannaschia sp. W003]